MRVERRVLNTKLEDQRTIREYLRDLLSELWYAKDGFSGKRPFGDSGWEYDIYQALVCDGLVDGEVDRFGYLDAFDQEAADKLIKRAILFMCQGDS